MSLKNLLKVVLVGRHDPKGLIFTSLSSMNIRLQRLLSLWIYLLVKFINGPVQTKTHDSPYTTFYEQVLRDKILNKFSRKACDVINKMIRKLFNFTVDPTTLDALCVMGIKL